MFTVCTAVYRQNKKAQISMINITATTHELNNMTGTVTKYTEQLMNLCISVKTFLPDAYTAAAKPLTMKATNTK